VNELNPDSQIGGLRCGPVLVTGATGFLGDSLLRHLLSGGIRVRALVRSEVKAKRLAEQGVEPVLGDINDRSALTAALDDVAVVYHLAGRLLEPGEATFEYRRTHIDGTKLLLSCCREQPQLKCFVHCSTTGVLGSTGEQPADENAPLHPTNVYEATKAEAELAVRAAWSEGFPAVIVRPGLVYGPGDLHLVKFFRSVLHRQFRPIGAQDVWLHPIYIDDMTDAFLRCGVRRAAIGECFHIAGPEPVSLERLAATIAAAEGTALPRGRIPLLVARVVAGAGDALPASLKHLAPLTRSRLDFLTHSRVYNVAKAKRMLDFVAPTDLTAGIARSVAWYRHHGYLPAGSSAERAEQSSGRFDLTSHSPQPGSSW
jgi:nucleoside-diphosphate-sugar epimerase